jgi:hypothetical protein
MEITESKTSDMSDMSEVTEVNNDADIASIVHAPPAVRIRPEIVVPDDAEAAAAAVEAAAEEIPNYGVFAGDYHDFAMLLRVEPANRLSEWEQALLTAAVPEEMSITVRKPTLVMFGVKADIEFMAIDKAMEWLNSVAAEMEPPITLRFNAQPSHEV